MKVDDGMVAGISENKKGNRKKRRLLCPLED